MEALAQESSLSDAPTCYTPEAALRYIDWSEHGLPYVGLYVIAASRGGPVKVGYSCRPLARLGDLQCGNWLPLYIFDFAWVEHEAEARQIEAEAHAVLGENGKALIGEWFDVNVEKAYEALEWAALTKGIELNVDLPSVESVERNCQRLCRIYKANLARDRALQRTAR